MRPAPSRAPPSSYRAMPLRRRRFMTLALGAFAWPTVQGNARAEPDPGAAARRIGVLTLAVGPSSPLTEAFRVALRERGYVEGRDLAFEYRFAAGAADRLPAMAAELVGRDVDVIVTESNAAAAAAKRATRTIPVVMAVAGDPVRAGVVASLSHPGGNVTGLTLIHPELSGKRLQLLKEAVPALARVAVLSNSASPASTELLRETEAAARSLGVQSVAIPVRGPDELQAAFRSIASAKPGGIVVIPDGIFDFARRRVVDFASAARLPGVFPSRAFAEAGGTMSYGPDLSASFRAAADFVDAILRGAKPADLPIQRPTKFEFVVNLAGARAIGLDIPRALILRADEVIG